MRLDELDAVCREAARNLFEREGRPLPPAVVLPLPAATRVTTLPDFPDDDPSRFDLLARFADEVMRPAGAPCYGFVAEAVAQDEDGGGTDVVLVAYGARGHGRRVIAAPVDEDGMGPFGEPEEVDAAALPFLGPLQHAADGAPPPGTAPVIPTG